MSHGDSARHQRESMHVTRSRPWQRGSETATGAGRYYSVQKLDVGNLLYTASHSHLLPLLEPLPVLRSLWKKKFTLRYRCFSHFNKENCWLPLFLVNIKILSWLFSLPQPTIAHIGYQEFAKQNHIIFTEYIQINDFSFELSPIRWIPQESQSLSCFYSKLCQS